MKQAEIEVGALYMGTANSYKPPRRVIAIDEDADLRRGGIVTYVELGAPGQRHKMSLESFARWARQRKNRIT